MVDDDDDAATITAPTTSLTLARQVSLGVAGTFALAVAVGLSVAGASSWNVHAPLLAGIGNLPRDWVTTWSFVTHFEPENALSIPTWAIHFSSVVEYLIAMQLVWQFSQATHNDKWKGLTWGMLPLHASGICACTYHFFYNDPSLQFLVTTQAGLTLLGNLTCLIAAFRIAQSNGWTWNELFAWGPAGATSPQGLVADDVAATPLQPLATSSSSSTTQLALQIVGITLFLSYAIKYGSLGIDLPFTPNPLVATGMIVGIPGITAWLYYRDSQRDPMDDANNNNSSSDGDNNKGLFSWMGGGNADDGTPRLSMETVKQYGVAGTVAYVLTELAFWAVAFPVAAYVLYQSTGHWPNVVEDTNDRTAVLALIFAGANVARVLVPLRLGAALALAPWVQENLLSGQEAAEEVVDGAGVDGAAVGRRMSGNDSVIVDAVTELPLVEKAVKPTL
jgi:hypothetical protein